ncbi:MAG: replication protein [Acinetobacter sp.]
MSQFTPNSFQVPNAFVDEVLRQIGDVSAKLYLIICRKTRGWYKEVDAISLTQFMEFSGKSRPTVTKALAELIQVGLIIECGSTIHGNSFKLNDDCSVGWMVSFPSKNSLPAKSSASASKDSLPLLVKNFNYASKDSLPLLVKILYTQKTLSKDTLQNKKINKKSESVPEQPKAEKQDGYPESFEKFWNAFPVCKRKSKKSETLKTFKKYESDFNLDFLLSILEKLKNSEMWIKNGGDYIPAPQAWLNQCQWENDYWVSQINQDQGTSQSAPAQQSAQQGFNLPEKPKGFLGGRDA